MARPAMDDSNCCVAFALLQRRRRRRRRRRVTTTQHSLATDGHGPPRRVDAVLSAAAAALECDLREWQLCYVGCDVGEIRLLPAFQSEMCSAARQLERLLRLLPCCCNAATHHTSSYKHTHTHTHTPTATLCHCQHCQLPLSGCPPRLSVCLTFRLRPLHCCHD